MVEMRGFLLDIKDVKITTLATGIPFNEVFFQKP